MDYQALLREIQKGKFAPVYFFYGEEDFLMEDAIDRIFSLLVDPATEEFNKDVLYGDEVDGAKIVNIASSYPMLAQRRVVVVKGVDKLSSDSKDLVLKYLQRPVSTTCLILTSPRIDTGSKFYSELINRTRWVEFKPLYDNQIPGWIREYVRSKGKDISLEAIRLLQGKVGSSLRELANEVEKLFLFVTDKDRIEVGDVEVVVGVSKSHNIFELSDAIGRRDLKKAVKICQRMLEVGESPIGMVVMLTRYFTILWRLKELEVRRMSVEEIASAVRVHPYFVKDYLDQAGNFSLERIERSFTHLLRADINLKSSYQRPGVIMELLIYNLIRG